MRIGWAFLPLLALALGGCRVVVRSGGGDIFNNVPRFTSADRVATPEGSTAVFYTATAIDVDGDRLTFSLSGGADVDRFSITSAGALSFRTAPDFEAPSDADRDNVYVVRIAVSDGRTSETLTLSVTVTDAVTGAFRVRRVATGFSAPLYATGAPGGSSRLLVVERGGLIRILTPSTGAIAGVPFLDVSGQISTDGERGLLGLALAPDFQQSGTAYVYLTNPAGTIEIRRYRIVAGNPDRLDPASADVILSIAHPTFSNHNGGWIDFGPDGFLYVATGDGGGANDPNANSQNRASLLGKMLRLDVNRDDFPNDAARDYAIPSGNPFANEVWAYGLRNPFRNSFDRVTGNLWIGDVGQNAIEEIDLMRASDAGVNFGWPLFEGTMALAGQPGTGFTFPVTEYGHGTGALQGNSVTGGYVYRGPVEQLQGLYIFGDFVRGAMWSVPISQLTPGTTRPSSSFTVRTQDFAPQTGSINNIASFGQDQAGNLYIVDFDGEIFVIEPVP